MNVCVYVYVCVCVCVHVCVSVFRKKTPSAISKYKAYTNKLTKIIRASEKSYFMNKFESVKTDIKKTWQLTKNVIKRNQNFPTDRISEKTRET